MKAIISVDHKTALLAGLDNQGEYTLNFAPTDLSEAQRVELSLSETRDGAFCANSNLFLRSSKYDDMLPKVAIADLDALRAILDARIVARTKYALDKRSQEERIVQQDIHDKTDDQLIWERNGRYSLTFDAENALIVAKRLGDQIAIERIDHLKQGLPALQAELDAKKKAKDEALARARDKREAEKAAAAKRRSDQIRAWVIAHGTDNQKARLGADMLPQAEVLDCIRAQVYAPLEGEPRYTKLSDEDVCQGTGYDDGYHDVDFSVEDATDLSADEWDRLCNLRERMPDATITVRRHIGQCNECEERAVRTSYHVAMQVGEFEFSREYGEPESDPE